MSDRNLRVLAFLVAAAVLPAGPAAAQTARSGGGGEMQKILQQYQQVAAEKTALQAQVAQAQKDLEAAKTELTSVKKERDALRAKAGGAAAAAAAVAQANASRETADKNLEIAKQRMNELVARYRDTANNLKEVEADRAKTRKDLDARNAAYDKCAEDNLRLYELGNEVLDRYERVGPFTKVSAAEPFTRLTRTRLENTVDEYRARALENRVKTQKPEQAPPKQP